MNYQTQTNLKLSLEGLAESVNNVAELTENMNRVVVQNEKNFKGTMNNLEDTSKNLSQLTDSLNQIPLGATIENFEQTSADLKMIISRLINGKAQPVSCSMMITYTINYWAHQLLWRPY